MTPALSIAARRLRERKLQTALLAFALALAAGIVVSSGILATVFHERSVRLRLAELPKEARSLRAEYRTEPERDFGRTGRQVTAVLSSFSGVTGERQRVRLWDPIAPADERGIRVVEFDDPGRAISVFSGRAPRTCVARVCEAIALSPSAPRGRVKVDPRLELRIVGRGIVVPEAVPKTLNWRGRLVGVAPAQLAVRNALIKTSSSVVATATLDPRRVHTYELDSLRDRLRREAVRIQRRAPVVFTVPLDPLDQLAREGKVARERLLIIAGQGAALVLAFAAFAAAARRRDSELLREQFVPLGASRFQLALVHVVEAIVPAALGVVGALVLVLVGLEVAAAIENLPQEFVRKALSGVVVATVAGVGLAATVVLFLAARRQPQRRLGFGLLDVAALTALAVVVWQGASTRGLDPSDLAADGARPVLLLVPSLAVLAGGVLLLRVLPLAFRLAERAARSAPFSLRLTFLQSARNPANAAAAITFLALALGTALFSLNYRETLHRHAADTAEFQAGARWRVIERGQFGSLDVSPLTRFSLATRERPTPVLRLAGVLRQTGRLETETDVTIVGLPASRLPVLRGWRDDFSSLAPRELEGSLSARPLPSHGKPLPGGASEIGFWTRSRTDAPRAAEAWFALPGDAFARLPLGEVRSGWHRVRATIPRGFAGARLVGLGFPPAATSPGIGEFDEGAVLLGPVEARVGSTWTTFDAMEGWVSTPEPGRTGFVTTTVTEGAPADRVVVFELNGTPAPFIRPRTALPSHPPALVGPEVAAVAVDGLVDVEVLGRRLRLRAAATSELFPTVLDTPSRFVVVDYRTLFTALNLEQPGAAPPSEAWFFSEQGRDFESRLRAPPFRLERAVDSERRRRILADDPLAAGAALLLLFTASAGSALALFALFLAARADDAAERPALAEYEALGASPAALARSAQYRALGLLAFGVAAGVIGAVLAVRLVTAFVAVTGAARRPLPPIEPGIAWVAGPVLVLVVAAAGAIGLRLVASLDGRGAAERLRA